MLHYTETGSCCCRKLSVKWNLWPPTLEKDTLRLNKRSGHADLADPAEDNSKWLHYIFIYRLGSKTPDYETPNKG